MTSGSRSGSTVVSVVAIISSFSVFSNVDCVRLVTGRRVAIHIEISLFPPFEERPLAKGIWSRTLWKSSQFED